MDIIHHGQRCICEIVKGGGNRYKNGNLYMLPNKAATVEERAAGKVCPPPNLNLTMLLTKKHKEWVK